MVAEESDSMLYQYNCIQRLRISPYVEARKIPRNGNKKKGDCRLLYHIVTFKFESMSRDKEMKLKRSLLSESGIQLHMSFPGSIY